MYYSAIIPMFNENPRALYVLKRLKECKMISEIICVDDGSTDGSYELISENIKDIILLKHDVNLGKLQAVKTGLTNCRNDNIILFDSDLTNIISSEIDNAINIYEKYKLDCLLLCTTPMNKLDAVIRFIFRLPHIATGCRIIKKDALEKSILDINIKGYQLEPAQNRYLLENHKKVGFINITAVGILKAKKVGFMKGIQGELKMWKEFLSYAGMEFNIRQIFMFARDKYDRDMIGTLPENP